MRASHPRACWECVYAAREFARKHRDEKGAALNLAEVERARGQTRRAAAIVRETLPAAGCAIGPAAPALDSRQHAVTRGADRPATFVSIR